MNNDILARILWTAGLVFAGLALYRLLSQVILTRATKAGSPVVAQGHPALLYFTTPDCAPCRTIQRPAILKVKQVLGDELEVFEINAQEQPEMAQAWGVLSVPTTFILDRDGKPRHVNHGVTSAEKLLRQMNSLPH
jgi:thiol-disulfide isomerase/thioredoxin